MNIVILGAGAIGSLIGAFLSKKNNVILIGRKFHINAIRKNYLSIDGKTHLNVNIPAVDSVKFTPDRLDDFNTKEWPKYMRGQWWSRHDENLMDFPIKDPNPELRDYKPKKTLPQLLEELDYTPRRSRER